MAGVQVPPTDGANSLYGEQYTQEYVQEQEKSIIQTGDSTLSLRYLETNLDANVKLDINVDLGSQLQLQPNSESDVNLEVSLRQLELQPNSTSSLQNPNLQTESEVADSISDPIPDRSNSLITSPYTEISHLLDLTTLDTPYRLMALALTKLQPITTSYATLPYISSFNWPEVIDLLRTISTAQDYTFPSTSFYIVIFRSTIRPSTSYPDLSALDKLSHAEANASGGFLKYWFGTPDTSGRNLATCVWRSQEDARRGSRGKVHRRAVAAAMGEGRAYEWFGIERLRFWVDDGVRAWGMDSWKD
eukprot:GHVU01112276.1.p1 GENE.GHVU01112276.1~~GHVU01112276.1.p1  ORF type:complete len:303 (+),score=30.41 GHVU01112276.1:76-984(+)